MGVAKGSERCANTVRGDHGTYSVVYVNGIIYDKLIFHTHILIIPLCAVYNIYAQVDDLEVFIERLDGPDVDPNKSLNIQCAIRKRVRPIPVRSPKPEKSGHPSKVSGKVSTKDTTIKEVVTEVEESEVGALVRDMFKSIEGKLKSKLLRFRRRPSSRMVPEDELLRSLNEVPTPLANDSPPRSSSQRSFTFPAATYIASKLHSHMHHSNSGMISRPTDADDTAETAAAEAVMRDTYTDQDEQAPGSLFREDSSINDSNRHLTGKSSEPNSPTISTSEPKLLLYDDRLFTIDRLVFYNVTVHPLDLLNATHNEDSKYNTITIPHLYLTRDDLTLTSTLPAPEGTRKSYTYKALKRYLIEIFATSFLSHNSRALPMMFASAIKNRVKERLKRGGFINNTTTTSGTTASINTSFSLPCSGSSSLGTPTTVTKEPHLSSPHSDVPYSSGL